MTTLYKKARRQSADQAAARPLHSPERAASDEEQPKYVLLDRRQSLGESLVSDGWTFGLLLLCIWASQGSKWWTFLTALMFLAFLLVKAEEIVNTRQHKFKDLGELEAWAAQERSNA